MKIKKPRKTKEFEINEQWPWPIIFKKPLPYWSVNLKKAKRIHSFLGKAIKYLERESK